LSHLQYGEVVTVMLTVLPEVKSRYDAWQADCGPEVLPHLVIGCVLEPFAKELFKSGTDEGQRGRACAFFEDMASSSDHEVVNLLAVEIFESWIGEPETLAQAWNCFGERTKEVATDMAHRRCLGKNLPRRWWQPSF